MRQPAKKTVYRVHFVDQGDNIYDMVVFEQDHDKAAIEHARRIHVPSIGGGFEVWHNDRLVYRHRR